MLVRLLCLPKPPVGCSLLPLAYESMSNASDDRIELNSCFDASLRTSGFLFSFPFSTADPADVLRLLDEDMAAKALHDASRQINGLKLETAWLRASLLALQMDLRAALKDARAAGNRAKTAEAELWTAETRSREAEEKAVALKNELWSVKDELLSVQGALRIAQEECDRQQQQMMKAEAAAAKAEAKLAAAQVKEIGPSGRKRLALWSSHLEKEEEKGKQAVSVVGGEAQDSSESWGMNELMEGFAAELTQLGNDNESLWRRGERMSVSARSSPVGMVKKEPVRAQQRDNLSWADLFVLDSSPPVEGRAVPREGEVKGDMVPLSIDATCDEAAGTAPDPCSASGVHLPSRDLSGSSSSSTDSFQGCHSGADSSTGSSGSVSASTCLHGSTTNAAEGSGEDRRCCGGGSGRGRSRVEDYAGQAQGSTRVCNEGTGRRCTAAVERASCEASHEGEEEEDDECSSSYSPLTACVGDNEGTSARVEDATGDKDIDAKESREHHPECRYYCQTAGEGEQQARMKENVEEEEEEESEGELEGEGECEVLGCKGRAGFPAEGGQQTVGMMQHEAQQRGVVGKARRPTRNGRRGKAKGGMRVRSHGRWGGGEDREKAAGSMNAGDDLADRIAMTVVKHLMTGRVVGAEALTESSGIAALQSNLLAAAAATTTADTTPGIAPPEGLWASRKGEGQSDAEVPEADLHDLGSTVQLGSPPHLPLAVMEATAPTTPPASTLGPCSAPCLVNETVESEEELVAQAQEQLQGVLRSSPFFSSPIVDEMKRFHSPAVDKIGDAAAATPALAAAEAGDHALVIPAVVDKRDETTQSPSSTNLVRVAPPTCTTTISLPARSSVCGTSLAVAPMAGGSSISSTPFSHATSWSHSAMAVTGRPTATLAATGRSISSSPHFPLLRPHAPHPLLPSHSLSHMHATVAELQMRHKAQLSLPFNGLRAGGGSDNRMTLSGVGRRKSDSATVQATHSVGKTGIMGAGVESILWRQWWM